jgi:hypothetical protein
MEGSLAHFNRGKLGQTAIRSGIANSFSSRGKGTQAIVSRIYLIILTPSEDLHVFHFRI